MFCFVVTDIKKKNMDTYCLNCRNNTENLNSKIFKIKNGRLFMKSNCPDCGNKKSRHVKHLLKQKEY